MALNSRELLVLEKAFAAGDSDINYESLYRLLAPPRAPALGSTSGAQLALTTNGTAIQCLLRNLVPRMNPSHTNRMIFDRFNKRDNAILVKLHTKLSLMFAIVNFNGIFNATIYV